MQTTIPENQKVCLLPMNQLSSTLTYDQRIAISSPVPVPVIWECSKVDNTDSKGITRFTFSQTRWNEHTDAFWYGGNDFSYKFDDKKKIYGIYADYYSTSITPEMETGDIQKTIHGNISWNAEPQLKVGGSFKKFTITFFDGENEEIPLPSGKWTLYHNNVDILSSPEIRSNESDNIIKIKFAGDDSWIGQTLQLNYECTDGYIVSSNIEIVGL